MTDPVISPSITTYASHTPYLTPAEYIASPTGVDVSQLVVNGDAAQQEDALKQSIARASSAIDRFCRKVLAATVDTQAGMYRIHPGGVLRIKLDNTPIIQINSVSTGYSPETLEPLSSLAGVWIGKSTIDVPVATGLPGRLVLAPRGRVYAVTSYVNGWANSLLAEDAAEGASSVEVDTALGILPGVPLMIYDPGASEQVVPTAVNGTTVTLADPLASAHQAGVAISALPPDVKQAAVLWTSALIKTRSDDAYVMPAMGAQPSQTEEISAEGRTDLGLAQQLLTPLRRVA